METPEGSPFLLLAIQIEPYRDGNSGLTPIGADSYSNRTVSGWKQRMGSQLIRNFIQIEPYRDGNRRMGRLLSLTVIQIEPYRDGNK